MPGVEPLVKLANLTKRFEAPAGDGGVVVLDHISLEVQMAESLAIVGPSGSGKSTLLHIIGTLERPTAGLVLLGGKDVSRLDDLELAVVRNREIGFVFQAHYLLPQCTVLENVLVPTLARFRRTGSSAVSDHLAAETPSADSADLGGESTRHRDQRDDASPRTTEPPADRAQRLLARVGLARRLAHRPAQLSGGECQRVAVVRALVNQPRLLLADEPTGSLDQASADQMGQLLAELNGEEKVTLIVVTHSRDLAGRMQRVLELRNGRLLSADSPHRHGPSRTLPSA